MANRRTLARGFSLIEMLLVLAIIGILALVAVSRVGNNYLNAVVSVTNQVEATLYTAQRSSTTSLNMVELSATGTWATKDFKLAWKESVPPPQVAQEPAPADIFQFSSNQADFRRAGVDPTTSGWPTGLGAKPALTGSDGAALLTALEQPMRGLTGGKVTITATRKEFSTPCFIAIVPMDSSGAPLYSGPAGLLILRGHLIYKYIRSESSQPWRRA